MLLQLTSVAYNNCVIIKKHATVVINSQKVTQVRMDAISGWAHTGTIGCTGLSDYPRNYGYTFSNLDITEVKNSL